MADFWDNTNRVFGVSEYMATLIIEDRFALNASSLFLRWPYRQYSTALLSQLTLTSFKKIRKLCMYLNSIAQQGSR